ncbi:ABC transporter substrate-binding protein [Sinorhizobium mexicanum]|uniref:Spermidine/putrescine ABC transporter substrate-binding protein n=1 Tax=Sinorhizobium mexicanum TaxID=375549 RepID=A0A859QWT3_9HYPH|nr:spermidine/putrescine ABC transporter substrate-binding protein [Sinorhizobium mexicanum]MBP1886410.1 spermidine/putrescine transport system substrate-binding protein [Sinorhizobium mexicanum]QLL63999.1 spermidine/putrescine ABC transporter substrate-binding protein [Sinorhizobium mexicanum]
MNRRQLLAATAAVITIGLTASASWAADKKIGGEINVLSWGNYIDFALPAFEEKYGVKVNIDYYADEKEAMNKIRAAGLGTYDVVFLGVGYEEVARKQQLIDVLDVSKLENFKDMYAPFQKPKTDGTHVHVTYSWGANGLIAYDPAKTGGPIKSWADVYSGKFRGRIGKIDKANEQAYRTVFQAGFKYGELSDEQWQAIAKTLETDMPHVRTVYQHYDEMAQLLAAGEIWIADTDDGGFRQAKAKGLNIELVYPEEGFIAWYDGPCLVSQAPHPEAAYAFIDHMISPEVQAQLAKELGYAPANPKAAALMDPALKASLGLDQAEANLSRVEFQRSLGAAYETKATDVWQKAKAQVQ